MQACTRNNTESMLKNNFLKIKLKGTTRNPAGIGAKVYAYAGTDKFYVEQNPVRGYQSSVDNALHLGLGKHPALDSLRIIWPDNASQLLLNSGTNNTLILNIQDAKRYEPPVAGSEKLLEEIKAINFLHIENEENDFAKQFLLPHFFSLKDLQPACL